VTDLVTTAREIVYGLLPDPLAGSVRIVTHLGELLETLAEAERTAENVRVRLNGLIAQGAASPSDYLTYNRMRRALYRAQVELYGEVISRLPSEVADQIPAPQMMPAPGVNVLQSIGAGITSSTVSGLGALGAAPAAAAAPAAPFAMAPWMWAVAAIAVLVALALIAVIAVAIATSAAAAATVGIAHRYAELAEASTRHRQAVYEECIANGTSPEECAVIARSLVPTPAEDLPDIPNPLDGMATIFKYGAIGLGLALAGYFGLHLLSFSKSKKVEET
jgi:hypothetical protein